MVFPSKIGTIMQKSAVYCLGKAKPEGRKVANGLCFVEQLLNNRPLTDVSSDVSDLQLLTPSHLLIGQVNVNWPNALFSGTPVSYRKLFGSQHSILVAVWSRRMNEYLPTLQQRTNGRRKN